jgi:hypothetical protein
VSKLIFHGDIRMLSFRDVISRNSLARSSSVGVGPSLPPTMVSFTALSVDSALHFTAACCHCGPTPNTRCALTAQKEDRASSPLDSQDAMARSHRPQLHDSGAAGLSHKMSHTGTQDVRQLRLKSTLVRDPDKVRPDKSFC